MLQGQRRAIISVTVFLILLNTQRRDKVKGRKGKRSNIVFEFRSTCSRHWIIRVRWQSPIFAVVMLHHLLVKMFEGVKTRVCPGVGISKVLPTYPFRSMRKLLKPSD
jgi:hypothetical protein